MTWRRWVVVGVVLVAGVIGLVYWRSSQVWNSMLANVDAKQEEMQAGTRERPVVWGDATNGNAWDDYDQVCERVKAASEALAAPDGDVGALIERWALSPESESKERDGFLANVQDALALLRSGAHRRLGRRAIAWEEGFDSLNLDVDSVFRVSDVASLQARSLIRRGEDVEAVRVILDAMQFGRDLFDDRRFILSLVGGMVMYRPGCLLMLESLVPPEDLQPVVQRKPAWSPCVLEALAPDALTLFEDGLAKLDRDPPWLGNALTAETVLLVRQIDRPGGPDLSGMTMSTAWELGFASRFLVGDAVQRLLETARALPPIGSPWPEVKTAIDAAESELEKSFNPLMMMVIPRLGAIERNRRETIANLRMLRMAVAEARGREVGFADPFGGTLRSAVVDGRTRYWSAGKDGKDDGGDPEKDVVRVR